MPEATLTHPGVEPAESPLTPESWGKLGMWIFLAGDAVGFGVLLGSYGAVRASSGDWPNPAQRLGITLTAGMTFLLICSSVTMVKALESIRRGDRPGVKRFLLMTIAGGLLFLGLQAYEWTHLIESGLRIFGNPWGATLFGASFFMITGFHGLHVTGGVVYLSVILAATSRFRDTHYNYMISEIAGLYWHFVDLVWIMVFTFVYLL
ncbi:MAG: cytochrome c oxidase subunit 3 [Candidatus Rokubacteria bacterium]|nr:cytochrome c oxidase subunit 3 [Candidatus Rokubacteria bacterium]